MTEQYVDRVHTGHAVLDIGDDVGALIVYTGPELRGKEIEVTPKGGSRRTHTDVLERRVGARPMFAALFLALPEGDYDLWRRQVRTGEARVTGGTVAEVDWRGLVDPHLPYIGQARPHTHRGVPI